MEFQIISTQMIKPSVPTPNHLRNYNLSFLDQIIPPFYLPLTLFYNTKFDRSKISEIHNHLKKSLSESLAIFYPLAGRVRDLVSVDCNDQGVRYVEATAKCTLSEYLKRPHLNSLNKFLPFEANVLKKGKDNILMSLQVTILECGGLVIGVCLFHRVCDIATMTLFLKTWANLFSGKGDKNIVLHQGMGSSLFPVLSSFPEDYESNATNFFFSEGNRSITRRFVFDASSVATLRAKATSENVSKPSRIEALTGFIIQRLMQQVPESGSVMITHTVNLRRRLNPPLPDSTFGNILWLVAAFYTPSESPMELSENVETLREVLQGMNGETLMELDPEDAIRSMSETQRQINTSDVLKDFKFTSWCRMGVYDVNFGWGKPAWVAHMGDAAPEGRAKHQFMFLEGKIGGEIELWALLDEHDMAKLENDEEFAAFATSNPSVPLEF